MSTFLEADSCFNCSICLSLFEKPKTLPNCGHSFCIKCLKQMLAASQSKVVLMCPECRAHSLVGAGGVEALQTNFAIQKAVEFLQANSTPSQIDRGCIHAKLMNRPSTCSHCDAEFCIGCLTRHVEELRLESLWIGSSLNTRFATLKTCFDMNRVVEVLAGQVAEIENEIDRQHDTIEHAVLKQLQKRRQSMKETVRKVSEAKLEAFQQFEGLVKDFDEVRNESDLKELNQTSILNLGSEEVAEMHTSFTRQSNMLSDFEAKLEELKGGQIGSSKVCVVANKNLRKAICSLDEIDKESFNWYGSSTTPHCRSERARLTRAVHANDFKTASEIFNRETLPPVVKSFLTNTKTLELFNAAASKGLLDAVKTFCPSDKLKCEEALRLAVIKNHLPVVEYLIERFPKLIHQYFDDKTCVFDLACRNSHLEIVKFLFIRMRDTDALNKPLLDQNLSKAIVRGHVELVRFFLETNVVNVDDNLHELGFVPIHLAVSHGQTAIVRLFLEMNPESFSVKDQPTLLHTAANNGYLSIVKMLIEDFGADVNTKNCNAENCLHLATRAGHIEVVKFLVESTQVEVAAQNQGKSNTPLHLALHHPQIVDYLVCKRRTLVLAKNKKDQTALDVARELLTEETGNFAERIRDSIKILEAHDFKASAVSSASKIIDANQFLLRFDGGGL